MKISPAGKLIYSTLLGTGRVSCNTGSSCIGKRSTGTVGGLAANATGALTVAEVRSFSPATISRVSPDGSKLLWTTGVQAGDGNPYVTSIQLAQDAAGNVSLFGVYGSSPYLVGSVDFLGLFAAKLTGDGSKTIYNKDLGESPDVIAQGTVLDSAGNAYVAGSSSSADFPTLAGAPHLGSDFLLGLDATGAARKLFSLPTGVVLAAPRIDASDRIMLLGAHGGLVTVPASYNFDSPLVVGFTNAASFEMNTGAVSGTLVSLFGYDLASAKGTTSVTMDGVTSPVIYAGATQLNVIVPSPTPHFGASTVALQVVQPSATISAVLPSIFSVGIFTTDGVHAAALNQDGSVNSAANPATSGSIVSVFGTGAVWPADMQTAGAIESKAEMFDPTQNPYEAFSGSAPTSMLYLGAAPSLYEGVFQMNAVVVKAFGNASIGIAQIGNGAIAASSNGVAIYVK